MAPLIFGPYQAVSGEVYDGATFHLDIDLGFGVHLLELRCRVFGISAPELATDAGRAAQRFLAQLLPPGCPIRVTSHRWDKFGGCFHGDVLFGSVDIAEAMLASVHAVPLRA